MNNTQDNSNHLWKETFDQELNDGMLDTFSRDVFGLMSYLNFLERNSINS